jgi:hypothetical protein
VYQFNYSIMQGRSRLSLLKSAQILVYADVIDIIGRIQSATIETSSSLEKDGKGMKLFINL